MQNLMEFQLFKLYRLPFLLERLLAISTFFKYSKRYKINYFDFFLSILYVVFLMKEKNVSISSIPVKKGEKIPQR